MGKKIHTHFSFMRINVFSFMFLKNYTCANLKWKVCLIFLKKKQVLFPNKPTWELKHSWHRCFPANSMKFWRTSILWNSSGRRHQLIGIRVYRIIYFYVCCIIIFSSSVYCFFVDAWTQKMRREIKKCMKMSDRNAFILTL